MNNKSEGIQVCKINSYIGINAPFIRIKNSIGNIFARQNVILNWIFSALPVLSFFFVFFLSFVFFFSVRRRQWSTREQILCNGSLIFYCDVKRDGNKQVAYFYRDFLMEKK